MATPGGGFLEIAVPDRASLRILHYADLLCLARNDDISLSENLDQWYSAFRRTKQLNVIVQMQLSSRIPFASEAPDTVDVFDAPECRGKFSGLQPLEIAQNRERISERRHRRDSRASHGRVGGAASSNPRQGFHRAAFSAPYSAR